MKEVLRRLCTMDSNPRHIVLLVVTLMVIVGAWAVRSFIFPAYDELMAARELGRAQAGQYARLTSNLAIQHNVNMAFDRLDDQVVQTASDPVTLSEFLRTLEQARMRYQDMRIVNVKPLRVQEAGAHRLYRVKLSIAAKLQDVLRFVSDLSGSGDTIGVEAVSLRGVQGLNMVECNLSLCLVRLSASGKGTAVNRMHRNSRENNSGS